MTRFRWIASLVAVGIATLATAFAATTPASAVDRNWTRTTHNFAGVVFHPHGDDFEVWNNKGPYDTTGYYAKIYYWVGIVRHGKEVFGQRHSFVTTLAHNTFRKNMPEYPHFVQFLVQSKRRVGGHHYLIESAPPVNFRTWGS